MIVAIGSWRPNELLDQVLSGPAVVDHGDRHYLYAEERRRVVEQLAVNYDFIVAQALRGTPSKLIAAGHGISREAVDRRLRPLGLKNPPGVRGRPTRSCQPVASQ